MSHIVARHPLKNNTFFIELNPELEPGFRVSFQSDTRVSLLDSGLYLLIGDTVTPLFNMVEGNWVSSSEEINYSESKLHKALLVIALAFGGDYNVKGFQGAGTISDNSELVIFNNVVYINRLPHANVEFNERALKGDDIPLFTFTHTRGITASPFSVETYEEALKIARVLLTSSVGGNGGFTVVNGHYANKVFAPSAWGESQWRSSEWHSHLWSGH